MTLAQLQALNTWIGSDCDASIFSGLTLVNAYDVENPVCVRAGGNALRVGAVASSVASAASSAVPPGPSAGLSVAPSAALVTETSSSGPLEPLQT
jgi:hypothetical protein